jgi:hypothetical protein
MSALNAAMSNNAIDSPLRLVASFGFDTNTETFSTRSNDNFLPNYKLILNITLRDITCKFLDRVDNYDTCFDSLTSFSYLEGNFLLIYIFNFHVLSHLLLIYICKLHWNFDNLTSFSYLKVSLCREILSLNNSFGNFLLIYKCNFHVLNNFLLIYVCKLHWNRAVTIKPDGANVDLKIAIGLFIPSESSTVLGLADSPQDTPQKSTQRKKTVILSGLVESRKSRIASTFNFNETRILVTDDSKLCRKTLKEKIKRSFPDWLEPDEANDGMNWV